MNDANLVAMKTDQLPQRFSDRAPEALVKEELWRFTHAANGKES